MAQLVVRNLPTDVKERLQVRAKSRGRSLEAEVREILSRAAVDEPTPTTGGEFLNDLNAKMRASGITDADVDELERIIEEGRKDWVVRPVEFD